MTTTYGCHNRAPFKPLVHSRQFGLAFPFRMNPDCQYTHTDLGRVDAKCSGCKHRAKEAA